MDPLTHGLVGVAISAFSGDAVSIESSITIGAMLGAMSPDLDFVIRLFKDDAAYLEHHRGKSHSVPYLAGFSIVITLLLSQMGFVGFSFFTTLMWTFLGALSHTGLDILNSYGAKLFKKKVKASLLTLYDPVITLVGLYFIINGKNKPIELFSGVVLIVIYLMIRNISRRLAAERLNAYFNENYTAVDVHVIPALKAFYKWDFVAHTSTHDIVGQFNPWMILRQNKDCIKISRIFEVADQWYFELFKSSAVGELFTQFSPNLHIKVMGDSDNEHLILRATDLRYFTRSEFMHHATLTLDKDHNFVSSQLHPYKLKKVIPVYQN